jgi:hypothetical protein
MDEGKALASKWLIVEMPLRPAVRPDQVSPRLRPNGEIHPRPVTTTLRAIIVLVQEKESRRTLLRSAASDL